MTRELVIETKWGIQITRLDDCSVANWAIRRGTALGPPLKVVRADCYSTIPYEGLEFYIGNTVVDFVPFEGQALAISHPDVERTQLQ